MFEQADARFDELVARVEALEDAVANMPGGDDFEDRLTALEARPRINVVPAAAYDPTEALPTDVLTVLVGTVAEVRNLQPDEAPDDDDMTFTVAVGFEDNA